jgi:hypothetical protein
MRKFYTRTVQDPSTNEKKRTTRLKRTISTETEGRNNYFVTAIAPALIVRRSEVA